jgi:LmbE family N-acetylglucosaminyl deacetylase
MSTNNMSGQLHIVEKDNSITRKECIPEEMMPIRKRECDKAASMLGTVPIHLDHPQRHYSGTDGTKITEGYGIPLPCGIPMGRPPIMTAHEDASSVRRLAEIILERDPEAVLTHSPVTESPEHHATALLATKAYRQAIKNGYKGLLLFWNEQTQSTVFRNTFCSWDSFIDISEFRQEQYDLIRCHITMVPFPERMDYLDFSPWCGCSIAEVFNVAMFENRPKAIGDFSEEIIRNYKKMFIEAR